MKEDRLEGLEDLFDKVRIVPVPCNRCGLDLVLASRDRTTMEKLHSWFRLKGDQWYLCTKCNEMYEPRIYWSCIITP